MRRSLLVGFLYPTAWVRARVYRECIDPDYRECIDPDGLP